MIMYHNNDNLCTMITIMTTYHDICYTRSPLQDSRLFGPRPWKILAATYEKQRFLSNPDPDENLVRGNLVMETGCNTNICLLLHTYITLHYITLHYITLHYITLHYITLHTYIHKYIHTYIHTLHTLHDMT